MSRYTGDREIVFGGASAQNDRHVLGYQIRFGSGGTKEPNSLIIPVPTLEPWAIELIDATGAPQAMEAIGRAVPLLPGSTPGGYDEVPLAIPGARSAWENAPKRVGYQIVTCPHATLIPKTIEEMVVPWMRPEIDEGFNAFLGKLAKKNPALAYVVVCFNHPHAIDGHTFLMEYRPYNPAKLFAPGIVHSPLPFEQGDYRDIQVAFGILNGVGGGTEVAYPTPPSGLSRFLPDRVVGFHVIDQGANAHYTVDVEAARLGTTGGELFASMPEHLLAAQQQRQRAADIAAAQAAKPI